jgi:hypothetical protein
MRSSICTRVSGRDQTGSASPSQDSQNWTPDLRRLPENWVIQRPALSQTRLNWPANFQASPTHSWHRERGSTEASEKCG